MNKEDYSKYLNHPLWLNKRNEVFLKHGQICSICNSLNNLEIHHKTYSAGKLPWEYPIENFLVLCEKCHGLHHGFEYTPNKCKGCGKDISVKYLYCLSCHNNLITEKEKEKEQLQGKIVRLESIIQKETKDVSESNLPRIRRLTKEKESLSEEINNINEHLCKIRELDEFKQEMQEKSKLIESQLDSLMKEKEKGAYNKRIIALEAMISKKDNQQKQESPVYSNKPNRQVVNLKLLKKCAILGVIIFVIMLNSTEILNTIEYLLSPNSITTNAATVVNNKAVESEAKDLKSVSKDKSVPVSPTVSPPVVVNHLNDKTYKDNRIHHNISEDKNEGRWLKGNINRKGEKIYHLPTGKFYSATKAERWFKSESEAIAAGYRKAKDFLIKGNINKNGEKIYHVPGQRYYDKTYAKEWFTTEEEALTAGYRKSKL